MVDRDVVTGCVIGAVVAILVTTAGMVVATNCVEGLAEEFVDCAVVINPVVTFKPLGLSCTQPQTHNKQTAVTKIKTFFIASLSLFRAFILIA